VDQRSADVQTETQKPQNQKNNKNCPKHNNLQCSICEHPNMSFITSA
jgi:hypothetical protein